jgi:hypothetical protein
MERRHGDFASSLTGQEYAQAAPSPFRPPARSTMRTCAPPPALAARTRFTHPANDQGLCDDLLGFMIQEDDCRHDAFDALMSDTPARPRTGPCVNEQHPCDICAARLARAPPETVTVAREEWLPQLEQLYLSELQAPGTPADGPTLRAFIRAWLKDGPTAIPCWARRGLIAHALWRGAVQRGFRSYQPPDGTRLHWRAHTRVDAKAARSCVELAELTLRRTLWDPAASGGFVAGDEADEMMPAVEAPSPDDTIDDPDADPWGWQSRLRGRGVPVSY